MSDYILDIRNSDKTKFALIGGKAASLGELFNIQDIQVPDGFCVTTEAYKKALADNAELNHFLNELSTHSPKDLGALTASIRASIERTPIPDEITEAVINRLKHFGDRTSFAIRSSATAEDLPTASFAGQQDTYLNITGARAILQHIRRCWASLFTERAVVYRITKGFDHRSVRLAVIIQRMVTPHAAGVMFTADPINGNRKTTSIEAVSGLGDALVSGLANADLYTVHDGKLIDKKAVGPETSLLSADQIIALTQIGEKIQRHFGCPQDIEWCLAGTGFFIVQSRPITTLFPIPEAADSEFHVYVSVGHQQMMTDPMKPLGLSLWQLIAFRPMARAAGRLFIDVAPNLSSAAGSAALLQVMGSHDPLIKDALTTIINRSDIIPIPAATQAPAPGNPKPTPPPTIDRAVIDSLIRNSQESIADLRNSISTQSGAALFDFIRQDITRLKKRMTESQSLAVIMAAINAASWLNEKMKEWLDEPGVADILSQSVAGNITAEMGLALLDVADAVRPYPEVIHFLRQTKDDNFLNELPNFKGGREAHDAIRAWLDKFGMRCAGEIDITRMRWTEQPKALLPLILSNIKNLGAGAGRLKFEAGRQQAMQKARKLLDQLKQLPDGDARAEETSRMISLLRNTTGYREYPKYDIVNHVFQYKQALMKEAQQLATANLIYEKEDVYYLTFDEFAETVRTAQVDRNLIAARKSGHASFERLIPPRVITSDGEIITGTYRHDSLPSGAIPGLPVSAGIVEGRARVILKVEDAVVEEGDILVTTFTDPGWTPLFVSVKGLVTEVGGLMTHGAVIAREYGLPAIVGVVDATRLIHDGQRIRLNGIEGYVQIL